MSMSTSSGGSGAPMADINVTPMVDVMLVLLIIFMITAPLASHKIRVDLPKASPIVQPKPVPASVDLAVQSDGQLYWNDNLVNEDEFKQKLAVAAAERPQPEIKLRADKHLHFKVVARVLSDAKQAGLVKIGFITTGK